MASSTTSPPEANSFDFGLGLDPSDPLNLLLNNSPSSGSPDAFMDEPSTSESSAAGSPPDWSQLEQLWATEAAVAAAAATNPQSKFQTDSMYAGFGAIGGFNFQDMNMIDPMAVDNTQSQYDAAFAPMIPFASLSKPSYSDSIPTDTNGVSPFQFSFQPHSFDVDLTKQRRLSDASSASSSGRSLSTIASVLSDSSAATSPVPAPAVTLSSAPVPVPGQQAPVIPRADESAEELAQRIRQTAGVMLAVPVANQPLSTLPQQLPPSANKLPIPRLPRPSKPAPKPKAATASLSGTSTPSLSESGSPEPPSAQQSAQTQGPVLGPNQTLSASGRPKTSHTTIERRYRTNLNARIQAIRSAVPALRILDPKASAAAGDVIDSQGLVDGVRAARKGSKATVLGKAVEYIRVLKRREGRLEREKEGLRALVSGLVGGPALLREWESAWRDRFGGPEKDALVEGEEEDDDEEEDEEGGSGEDGERAKKKAKVVPAVPKKKETVQPVTGEKRKRGRPRKVVPGAEVPAPIIQQQQPPAQAPQPGQYLLAVFALFSFANSPLASSSTRSPHHAHTHHGSVLNHNNHPLTPPPPMPTSWRDVLQAVHFVATILVLISVAAPWIPSRSALSKALWSSVSTLKRPLSSDSAASKQGKRRSGHYDRSALLEALSPAARGTPDEKANLRAALGVSSGLAGLFGGLVRAPLFDRSGKKVGFEQRGLEQRAWVRLGELAVLDPAQTSFASKLQIYTRMMSHVSWFTASAADLVTLALLLRPVASGRAGELWKRARRAPMVRAHERLVLEVMDIGEAVEYLGSGLEVGNGVSAKRSPLDVLAYGIIRARLRKCAAGMFVKAVCPGEAAECFGVGGLLGMGNAEREELRRVETIEAARSFGGGLAALGDLFERVGGGECGGGVEDVVRELETAPTSSGKEESMDESTAAILRALVLYRRLFPSSLHPAHVSGGAGNVATGVDGGRINGGVAIMLSPPPSPSRRNAKLRWALRTVLGDGVFESVGLGLGGGSRNKSCFGLGERKDRRVVDLEVDSERADEEDEEGGGVLGGLLEDARDRVVDLLVDFDRRGRMDS